MFEKAKEVYRGITKPNSTCVSLLFKAYAQSPTEQSVELVKQVWKSLPDNLRSDTFVLTSVLNVLMTCGHVNEAESVFRLSTKKAVSMHGAMMKGRWRGALLNDR